VQKEEEDALIKNNKKSGLTMKVGLAHCHNIACHQHMDTWNLENKKIRDFVPRQSNIPKRMDHQVQFATLLHVHSSNEIMIINLLIFL
jgi:hypothetical protein